MFRIFILIIGFLLCSEAICQQPIKDVDNSNSEKSVNNHSDTGKDVKEISFSLLAIIEKLDHISSNLAPDQKRQAEDDRINKNTLAIGQSDLVQQERMAWSSAAMAITAIIALGISLWGIVLLYRNLSEAKNATGAALIAARAAEETIKKDRAWVVMAERELQGSFIFDVGTEIPLRIVNAGGTPALNVRVEHRIQGFHTDEIGGKVPSIEPQNDFQVIGILGPTISHPGGVFLRPDMVLKLSVRKCRFFIYTLIKYDTIYEPEKITEFVEEVECTASRGPTVRQYEFRIFSVGQQHKAT